MVSAFRPGPYRSAAGGDENYSILRTEKQTFREGFCLFRDGGDRLPGRRLAGHWRRLLLRTDGAYYGFRCPVHRRNVQVKEMAEVHGNRNRPPSYIVLKT